MKNRLTALVAGLALTAGCASPQGRLTTETSYQRTAQRLESTTLHDFELRRATERDHPYSLEEAVIHGERYFLENNPFPNENEANVAFTKYEDHKRILDSEGGLLKITSDFIYVPAQVLNEKDKPATRATFTTTGKYAVRANLKEFNTEGVQSGIIRTTNKDAPFNIRTKSIGGEEFFLPYVGDANLKDDSLNFYLIPHLGTLKEIDAEGVITLENSEGFFRPLKVSRAEFEARQPTMPATPTVPENNLGEAMLEPEAKQETPSEPDKK